MMTDSPASAGSSGAIATLIGRIARIEVIVAALVAVAGVVLVIIEPNVLEAPFENANTLLFTFGGTLLAALVFVAMLWFGVPAPVRILVLAVPLAAVNWWLISPYFIDEVVDEEFTISITDQSGPAPTTTAPDQAADDWAPSTADVDADEAADPTDDEATTSTTAEPQEPVLLGAGQFVGLAGHDGTGDAGIILNPDGTYILRFENFDIENGPDLDVYLVPGADQVSLPEGTIALGDLKGNIGDQNYELPPGTELAPGPYTALVWCEAFDVEFVGATVII
ncbi:MAG: DM13 domain-containing protein [Actinomycetota bacterium]